MEVALLSETSKNLIWFGRRTIVTEILFNIDSSKIDLKKQNNIESSFIVIRFKKT